MEITKVEQNHRIRLGLGPFSLRVYLFTFHLGLGGPYGWISADLLERRACETTFHASFLISVSQPAAASQQQPASCSQPAKPAFQASQPASQASQPTLHPGIEASGLQPAGIDVSKLLIRGIQSGATGRHSPPQVATGRHRLPNFLAPTAPGGQPNIP